jgi:hypothetical protein
MEELITKAHKTAEEILALTQALTFTGEPGLAEQEVEAYAGLIDKREPLIEELRALAESTAVKDPGLDKIITEIIALDKRHREVMDHIHTNVRASIKDVKDGKRLSSVYAHPLENEPDSLLDAKQ